jgi:transcription elongation GreA/GreB family factor
MERNDVKRQLLEHCLRYLVKRINTSKEAIQSAQVAANEETKSSSGDKYETGRAMMQIEIEQNSTQLNESLKLKDVLDKINVESNSEKIQPGSLVVTTQGNFFIAISVGKVIIEDNPYFVVSAESPIGAKMIGMQQGDSFSFANKTYEIEQVL